jgi:hypothetical protein
MMLEQDHPDSADSDQFEGTTALPAKQAAREARHHLAPKWLTEKIPFFDPHIFHF